MFHVHINCMKAHKTSRQDVMLIFAWNNEPTSRLMDFNSSYPIFVAEFYDMLV